jgi:hypothetical protein
MPSSKETPFREDREWEALAAAAVCFITLL